MNNDLKHGDKELCPICVLRYVHLNMGGSILRCGGLSYKKENGEIVARTRTGQLWSEVLEEQAIKDEESKKKHYAENKKHVDEFYEDWEVAFDESLKKKNEINSSIETNTLPETFKKLRNG